jgi:hydroxymethylglutaryl-CoA lyase
MADTKQVIEKLEPGNSKTRLLAIVANTRGASDAASYPIIEDIGFPFSISETFQQRNTNSTIERSKDTVSEIQEICARYNKRLVIYISMAFGNPYDDPWSPDIAMKYISDLVFSGVEVISLADTVGLASEEQVFSLTSLLKKEFPGIEAGVHLHSHRETSIEKLEAAFRAGCRRFDGALNGIGGCPMAGDELVGNMDSLLMIDYFRKNQVMPKLNDLALEQAAQLANEIFIKH